MELLRGVSKMEMVSDCENISQMAQLDLMYRDHRRS
jgi:hypothetical protein